MYQFATHEQFVARLDNFLKQAAMDCGMSQPKDANMLQFVIGLASAIGPKRYDERPPYAMAFRSMPASPMKTIIQLMEPGATHSEAQCIAQYFNQLYQASSIAKVVDLPYIKGKHPTIEILSGALMKEIDHAIEYQEIFRGSVIQGARMFNELPIKKSTRVELAAVGAAVTLTPAIKAGLHQHEIEFRGISETAQADIVAAINTKFGEGSAAYA